MFYIGMDRWAKSQTLEPKILSTLQVKDGSLNL
jgi:hypothetical protein